MDNLNLRFQHAVQLHQGGHLIDAVIGYRQVLERQPMHPQAHYNLALALQALHKIDEAIASYRRAISVNPKLAEAHNNLGNIFQDQNRLDEAGQSYQRALAINPRLVQSQYNLGLVLRKQNKLAEAVPYFEAALALAPEYADAFDNLNALLMSLGRTDEWLTLFQKHEKLARTSGYFFVAGLSACRNLGDFAREQEYLQLLSEHRFKDDDIDVLDGLLSTVQYFDVPQAQLLRLYQAYNAAVKRKHFAEFPLVSPYRPQRAKMRIGYLSADFRVHVMGWLMLETLSRHDRSQFEVYLYSLSGKEDAVTAQFRAICDKFVPLQEVPAPQAAKIIAADDLDILIDLCNHTTDSNPLILAYKPARVQISHLGAHGAIGLDTVDYKLSDHYVDVPENADYMLEKLLPMEGCIFPFRHIEPGYDERLTRAALGIDDKALVLGVFVNIMKLSPRCLKAWAEVLQRLKHAVLAFSPFKGTEHASFLRQVGAAGIDPDRVVFIPAPKDEQLARGRYRLVDMVLDTFPYSGGDTTLAALDMGVPVVTLCGTRHSERTSYSILMNLGVPDTVAYSEAEFVELACRLGSDAQWRETVVRKIRDGLQGSPLVDMEAYTRHLEEAYRSAIASCPVQSEESNLDVKTLFQDAVRQHQMQHLEQAGEQYRRVLAQQPDHAPALFLYGRLLAQTGADDEAISHLERAIASSPSYLDAQVSLADLFLKHGRLEEALAGFAQALRIKPQHAPAMTGLARALIASDRTQEAIEVLRQVVAHMPEETDAYFNLGIAYQKLGSLELAAQAYIRVLALAPDNLEAQFNLGVLFQEHAENERAAVCYQRTLQLRPDFAPAYYHLGDVLFNAGKLNQWLETFQQFRANTPPSMMLAVYGLQACQYLGEIEQRQAYLQGLIDGAFPAIDAGDEQDRLEELLFLALYLDFPQRDLFALYQRYNALCAQAFSPRLTLPPREAGGKIRIGYLSGDMRDHVMGKMMYQAISRHDTSRFEVFSYSLAPQEDAWTERYRECSQHFVSLARLDAHTAAQRIADDCLDILVDLSTHTKGGLPAILAFKPARVLITHIASAGAVGLEAIDFKLTDRFADAPSNQEYLIERLLPMEGCVFPFRHVAPAAYHAYQRARLNIPKDAIVLGAFVNLMKLSTRCVALWRQVLDALPQAVLAFSPVGNEARAGYLRWMNACGVPAQRIVFVPQGKDEAHNQARYSLCDFVLDTMPYGGVNSTLEALDMGIPVVTLCGERHGERTGYSILTNLGVTATIAHDEQEYVDIAKRLALDGAFRAAVVGDIRRGMENSALVDMEGHTRHLEEAYRRALAQKEILSLGDA